MSYFKSSKKFLSVSFYSIIIPCLFFNSAFLATKEPSPPQSNRLVIMLSQNEEDVFSEPLAWTLGSAIGTVPVICSAAYFMNYLKMIQEEFIIEAKDKAEISHDYKQKLLKILSIFNNKFYRLQNSKLLLHIPVSRNMKPDYQGFAELLKYDPRGFLELDFGNFLALKKEFEAISSSEQVKEAIQKLNRLIDDMLEKLKDMFIQESLVMSGESRGQVKYFETGSLTMLQELPTISIRTGDSLCTIEQFEKLLYPPAQQELEAIKKQMLQAVTVHEESFPKKVMSKKIETENFLETLKKSLEKFKKYTDLYVKEYIDQYIEKNKDQLTEKDINLLNAHIKKLEIPFVRHRQQESESAQTIIDDINTLLNNLKNSLNPANSTGSNVTWNNIRAQLGKLIDDHVIYEKPWNILWMGHGAKLDYYRPIIKNNTKYYTNTMIANTDIETLSKLLSVFDVIGTRSLQLWSCYSGGQHREYIVPQFFSLSYPIALLSATDETMTAGNTPQYREYFEKIEESKQKKEDLSWFEDATAWLNYFINRKTLTNIPIIKPSHSDRFYFFEATSKKVEKLLNEKSAINFESNSLSEKDAMALYYGAILENNLITKRLKNSNFIFYNKQNILIYPEVVDIPVIIRPFIIANSSSGNKVVFPFITSIRPGSTLHIFKEMHIENPNYEIDADDYFKQKPLANSLNDGDKKLLHSFFIQSFNTADYICKRTSSKFFFIKTINCDKRKLENVFILTENDQNQYNVHVYFKEENEWKHSHFFKHIQTTNASDPLLNDLKIYKEHELVASSVILDLYNQKIKDILSKWGKVDADPSSDMLREKGYFLLEDLYLLKNTNPFNEADLCFTDRELKKIKKGVAVPEPKISSFFEYWDYRESNVVKKKDGAGIKMALEELEDKLEILKERLQLLKKNLQLLLLSPEERLQQKIDVLYKKFINEKNTDLFYSSPLNSSIFNGVIEKILASDSPVSLNAQLLADIILKAILNKNLEEIEKNKLNIVCISTFIQEKNKEKNNSNYLKDFLQRILLFDSNFDNTNYNLTIDQLIYIYKFAQKLILHKENAPKAIFNMIIKYFSAPNYLTELISSAPSEKKKLLFQEIMSLGELFNSEFWSVNDIETFLKTIMKNFSLDLLAVSKLITKMDESYLQNCLEFMNNILKTEASLSIDNVEEIAKNIKLFLDNSTFDKGKEYIPTFIENINKNKTIEDDVKKKLIQELNMTEK